VALQALYQWDLRGEDFRNELPQFLVEWARSSEESEFARELVNGCRENIAAIDARIEKHAQHWSLARMATLDRNILRLAAYEMLYRDDIPPKVSIDEAVALAKKFSTEESGAFVNGILDPLMAALEAEKNQASNT
jgi:3',5'-nucleoside bisphosphate phosphatase